VTEPEPVLKSGREIEIGNSFNDAIQVYATRSVVPASLA
jgi:hypothetical protein